MRDKLFIAVLLTCLLPSASCEKQNPEGNESVKYELTQARSQKRGVSFSFSQVPDQDVPLLGKAVSWSYDWSSNAPNTEVDAQFSNYGMDWCPMAWNGNYNTASIKAYKAAHPEAQYILAFNEPNLTDQANMTPAKAAELWPALKALANELGMKIISPAMNYGTLEGYHDPWKWLDEFFAQDGVSLEDVSGIAIHSYMPSAGAVQNFINGFKKYGKPIWLTEFCNGNSNNISETAQMAFMCEAMNMLEAEPAIFRYAWFIPRGASFNSIWHNSLLTNKVPVELTPLGKVFVNFSTFDKNLVYSVGQIIPAEQYVSAAGPVHCEPSTDGGILDLINLKTGGYTEYQIDVPAAGKYIIALRYNTYMESSLTLSAGDNSGINLPDTGEKWQTTYTEMDLPSGRSVLRLSGNSAASVKVNWLKINNQ